MTPRIFAALTALVLGLCVLGCGPEEPGAIQLQRTSPLGWKAVVDGKYDVLVKGHIFEPSSEMINVFDQQMTCLQEEIASFTEDLPATLTGEARQSLQELSAQALRRYEEYSIAGPYCAASWEKWPVFIMYPLISGPEPRRALVACRFENGPTDFGFAVTCKDRIDLALFVKIMRLIAREIEMMPEDEFARLPREDEKLFNSEGAISAKAFRDFLEAGEFMLPHPDLSKLRVEGR